MGSCSSNLSRSAAHKIEDIPIKPSWTFAVEVKPIYLKDKISPFSDGFRSINNNTVELTGTGKNKIEGAQWSRGFTSGKHVIEFIFPIHLRTKHSRVGIAPEGTQLGGNDLKRVVGGRGSWAVDLKSKVLFENGKNIGVFPARTNALPDWFFMYIDLDTGTLQFGSDSEFFGTAFIGIQSDRPLYPMVTASGKGAIVSIVYRGKGKEIEGPLRKNRTLAAVRRSARARERERVCEKHRKEHSAENI